MIYDATLYPNKSGNGLTPTWTVYANYMRDDFNGVLWGGTPGANDADLITLVGQVPYGELVLIDCEQAYQGDATAIDSIKRMVTTARVARPDLMYGAYYIPRTYPEGASHPGTLAQVQAANNNPAVIAAAAVCDVLCPEAYTRELSDWPAYMRMGVSEAQRIVPGKPVMPVLSLTFPIEGWAGPPTNAGALPPAQLTSEVKQCLAACGNVILWGVAALADDGSVPPWSTRMPWYKQLCNDILYLGPAAMEQLCHGNSATCDFFNSNFPGQ